MSSIHYKFRSLTTFKTVNFDTLYVSTKELKRAIFDGEGLSDEMFELDVESSHSKRAYADDDIIPRNSSLIIKRLPRSDASKLPKVQDSSTSGVVSKMKSKTFTPNMSFLKTDDFSQMTEEQRLECVQQVSYEKYHPANYQRKTKCASLNDPPPISYTCNRCNQPGHWVKNCPMANVKRTTGIPIEDLIETTPDHPYAMLHPSGRFMVHRMHVNARMSSKVKAPVPFIRDEDSKLVEPECKVRKVEKKVPSELKCQICHELMSDAVIMACCGFSFCAICIQNSIIEDPSQKCPGEGCSKPISIDSMVQNLNLRKFIAAYQVEEYQPKGPDPTSVSAYRIKKSPN